MKKKYEDMTDWEKQVHTNPTVCIVGNNRNHKKKMEAFKVMYPQRMSTDTAILTEQFKPKTIRQITMADVYHKSFMQDYEDITPDTSNPLLKDQDGQTEKF